MVNTVPHKPESVRRWRVLRGKHSRGCDGEKLGPLRCSRWVRAARVEPRNQQQERASQAETGGGGMSRHGEA